MGHSQLHNLEKLDYSPHRLKLSATPPLRWLRLEMGWHSEDFTWQGVQSPRKGHQIPLSGRNKLNKQSTALVRSVHERTLPFKSQIGLKSGPLQSNQTMIILKRVVKLSVKMSLECQVREGHMSPLTEQVIAGAATSHMHQNRAEGII